MSNNWNAEFAGCCNVFPACWLICSNCTAGAALLQGITFYEMNGGQGGCGECCIACWLCCIGLAINRGKIREKYNIHGSFIVDCLLYWIGCSCCMVTQEYREVRLRNAKPGQ
ncbi:unnamed protein product [Blepharisma stoltei]|uniref:Uncharacterized protein n=1 Tax=Blepharisma stoltei TaxID=1481888 RepID=A0AAU9JMB7_9CILI|nr:unnamed protein product [Blepharisma stoltei]